MFPSDDLEQSSQRYPLKNCINWQSGFIRDNFLVLGYFAWLGFRLTGGGLLLCDIEPPPVGNNLKFHTWEFMTKFVPHLHLAHCLLALELSPTEIPELVELIAKSDPDREIVLLIRSNRSVEILWLKNLAIDPPNCYFQVRDRWDEFMSNPLPPDLLK